jgi:membrane-associated phospholipid phosphatase
MPSLHIAFAVLVALMIGIRLRSRWRYLLALYPLAMGFALVYTGEHYVLDLVFGVLYALAAHLGVSRWEVWRARRSTTTLAEATALDPPAQEALEAR